MHTYKHAVKKIVGNNINITIILTFLTNCVI